MSNVEQIEFHVRTQDGEAVEYFTVPYRDTFQPEEYLEEAVEFAKKHEADYPGGLTVIRVTTYARDEEQVWPDEDEDDQ